MEIVGKVSDTVTVTVTLSFDELPLESVMVAVMALICASLSGVKAIRATTLAPGYAGEGSIESSTSPTLLLAILILIMAKNSMMAKM